MNLLIFFCDAGQNEKEKLKLPEIHSIIHPEYAALTDNNKALVIQHHEALKKEVAKEVHTNYRAHAQDVRCVMDQVSDEVSHHGFFYCITC